MIYVAAGGVLRCEYVWPSNGWEWHVECLSTGLVLAEMDVYSAEGWSIADDPVWPGLAAVLDGAAGDAPGTYEAAMIEAAGLHRLAFDCRDPRGDVISDFRRHFDPTGTNAVAPRDPFADIEIRPEDFREYWLEVGGQASAASATKRVRAAAIELRRSEFDRARPAVVLKMIEAGHLYRCASVGCGETENLTVDHRVPLSRGGSDDVSNLQFLCRSHNSQKGSKPWTPEAFLTKA